MEKKIGNIYETNNYGIFRIKEENRLIDTNKVNMIKKQLKHDGRQLQPIIVNDKYEIYDGQHRYIALKELGWNIKYFIDPELTTENIISMNTSQNKWQTPDYLHKQSIENNEFARTIIGIQERLGFTAPVSLRAICGKNVNDKTIRMGEYEFTPEQYTNGLKKLQWLYNLEKEITKTRTLASKRAFERTLLKILDLENINQKRLYDNIIKKYGEKKYKYGNLEECEQALEEIYNYKETTKRPIAFEIRNKK